MNDNIVSLDVYFRYEESKNYALKGVKLDVKKG